MSLVKKAHFAELLASFPSDITDMPIDNFLHYLNVASIEAIVKSLENSSNMDANNNQNISIDYMHDLLD